MSFDYSKLRGRIKELCGTQDVFSKKIGIGTVSLSKRLNNQLEFTQREIATSCAVLGIPLEETSVYFFAPEVQKHEH